MHQWISDHTCLSVYANCITNSWSYICKICHISYLKINTKMYSRWRAAYFVRFFSVPYQLKHGTAGFFSSPELRAQVSFSDRLSSVVCLFVHPSVRPSVFNVFIFRLLLKNHWANFNQTWHKAFLGERDSSLFNWRAPPFSEGRLLQNSKNTLTKLKNLLLQNHLSNFNQTCNNASLDEGHSSSVKWKATPFSKRW